MCIGYSRQCGDVEHEGIFMDKTICRTFTICGGDYSPTPSSLIGALAINLGISVRNLSKDKEEDLRRQYFCWWSKPLPEQYSFRRILCFEGGFGSRGSNPPKVVGAVFRCLVPILSGKGNMTGSVIMPLLASGDQGYSRTRMLRLIMDSAIHWIKAGLSLKTLKIVLYSRNPQKHDRSFASLFECFQMFKDKYEEKELAYETDVIYDVYVSHSPKDHDSAMKVVRFLQTAKNMSVFHDFQELNDNESWQEEIFNIMAKCARVIALLSPGYLETESCIEQYNIALCINRHSKGNILAPFYITSIDYMPTYMSLIQYEDCRPTDDQKIKSASHNLAESLKEPSQKDSYSKIVTESTSRSSYDVFISYSHQNKAHAERLLETLRSLDPDLKIFIDTSGLNIGTSWQQLLYTALDVSKSTIALLSPDYIKSKVCYEEFSLSYALFVDKDSSMDLVSLLVEPVNELPQWCKGPQPVDCVSSDVDIDQLLATVCTDLVNRLKGSALTADETLSQRVRDLTKNSLTLELAMVNYRKSCFVLQSNVLKSPVDMSCDSDKESFRVSHVDDVLMSIDGHHLTSNPTSVQATNEESSSSQELLSCNSTCDIALSFANSDRKSAMLLKQLLLEKLPSLNISEPVSGDFVRVKSLDVARVIVPLLSPAFLASNELLEELNIAIYRNRSFSRQILFPIQVAAIPPKPTYVRLIPCEFSSADYKWACKIVGENRNDAVFRVAEKCCMDVDEVFCLHSAANGISQQLLGERKQDVNLVNRVLLNVRETEECWMKVRKALYEQQQLEVWKKAFGIQIKSSEDHLKPSESIQQSNGKIVSSEPNEMERVPCAGDGRQWDPDIIKNNGQEITTQTEDPSSSSNKLTTTGDIEDRQNSRSDRRRKQNKSRACFII